MAGVTMLKISSYPFLSMRWNWRKLSWSSQLICFSRLQNAPCCGFRAIQFLAQTFFSPDLIFCLRLRLQRTRRRRAARDNFSIPAISSARQAKMTPSQNAILLATIVIWLSKMLTSSAHDEKLASRGKNYQTRQIFVSRPREAKFSPKFCRTRAETAEQTVSRGKELSCLPQVCAGLNQP